MEHQERRGAEDFTKPLNPRTEINRSSGVAPSRVTPHPIRVGIVDDDECARSTLILGLSTSPHLHIVAAVGDGEAAIRLARSGEIDVLVLDVQMPTMDGREALRQIRALAPSVRVVMHSSLPASRNAAELEQAGAAAYVEKPCRLAAMMQVIRDVATMSADS